MQAGSYLFVYFQSFSCSNFGVGHSIPPLYILNCDAILSGDG